jgi:hypothetical protein
MVKNQRASHFRSRVHKRFKVLSLYDLLHHDTVKIVGSYVCSFSQLVSKQPHCIPQRVWLTTLPVSKTNWHTSIRNTVVTSCIKYQLTSWLWFLKEAEDKRHVYFCTGLNLWVGDQARGFKKRMCRVFCEWVAKNKNLTLLRLLKYKQTLTLNSHKN